MIATTADDFRAMRHAMVTSQLRTNAVSDPRVVAAMDGVAREAFVPPSLAPLAYRDTAIPLDNRRALNLPMATARLLNEAQLLPTDRVLLIGDATGYTAAVLARLVAAVVVVVDAAEDATAIRSRLDGLQTVSIEVGMPDGPGPGGRYDVVVIDGAVEQVPDALWSQLHDGGRLVTGLVERGVTRLAAGRRSGDGAGLAAFADADCVVLPGFARSRGFVF